MSGGPAAPSEDCAVLQGSPQIEEASRKHEGLAHQALARDQPLLMSQELLAAAVANYAHSVRNWSFALDTKSPPPPPPAPQSSPVEFPVSGVYHLVPLGELARQLDAGPPMDSTDVPIQ